jgi:hypothetical protein
VRGSLWGKAVAIGAAIVVVAACSGGSDESGHSGERSSSTTSGVAPRSAGPRPDGPFAELTEITAPGAPFVGEATPPDLAAEGYIQEEFIAAGTATSYRPEGELTDDGRWSFVPDASAPYRTRVIVRRPARSPDFSGTALVEWMNVSGGVDANPEWASLGEEIMRRGHAWVGVSAQRIGVMGGPPLVAVPAAQAADVAGKGLVGIDPARYGTLDHPGDGFSFDIFTQVARAVDRGDAIGIVRPHYLHALGESQSAIALTTYYDGVQPLTHAFDGFFVHSRAATALPLVAPGEAADLASSFGGVTPIFRTDGEAPVMQLQAEADVFGVLDSLAVRQPDTDRFRLWEVAGTAHADAHLLGPIAAELDCGVPINDAPMHVVAKAALRGLDLWVRTGRPPAKAPRLEVAEGKAARDADGIARGGLRTPPLDVPVDVLSGEPGPNDSLICLLLGSTTPLPDARIAALYESRADYERRYGAAVDATIDAGFAVVGDREALLGYSAPSRVRG